MNMKILKKYIVMFQCFVLICIAAVPFAVSRGIKFPFNNITKEKKTGEVKYTPSVSYTVGGEKMDEYIKGSCCG